MKQLLLSLFFCLQVCVALGAPITVEATLDPEAVALGEQSRLIIQVKGTTDSLMETPEVDGCVIRMAGHESNYTSINGSLSSSSIHYFNLEPTREGEISIPPISVDVDGKTYQTRPLKLIVHPGTGNSSALAPQSPAAPSSPRTSPASGGARQQMNLNQAAELKLIVPRETIYLGQMVPVEIKLVVREGYPMQVRSLPVLQSSAFTVNKFSTQPEQKIESIGGSSFQTVTWHTAISPAKTGDFSLGVDLDVTVLEKIKTAQRSGFFDDPFFNSFMAPTQAVNRSLSSSPLNCKVVPLPETGKPDSFSGAIGNFSLNVSSPAKQVAVGEPVTLKFELAGQGNFDRVNLPKLESNNDWKVYPPTSRVELSDSTGVNGKKTFEQIFIPQRGGLKTFPKVVFSYFDPETEKYVEQQFVMPEISVTGNSLTRSASQPEPKITSGTMSVPAVQDSVTLSDKTDVGKLESSKAGAIINRPMVWIASLLFVGLLVAGLWRTQQRLRELNPGSKRITELKKAIDKAAVAMRDAEKNDDAQIYFSESKKIIQNTLALKWGANPNAIDLQSVEQRDPALYAQVRPFFEKADELIYSGTVMVKEDLRQWEQRFSDLRKKINFKT